MALLTPSPFVSSIAGKAGSAVAASWKGRNYIRKWVIPHNPQTPAQDRVRDSMARIPPLWRSLLATIKAVLDTYATAYRMSGYNWFAKQNRLSEELYDTAFITPPNIYIDPALTLTLTDQTGGSVKADWTGGTQAAGYYATLLFRRVDTGNEENKINLAEEGTTLFSVKTKTFAVGTNRTVRVFLIDEKTADHTYSSALSAEKVMAA